MTEQNESQEGSNPSTFEGDVVGTMDSDVLEEELLADLQPRMKLERKKTLLQITIFASLKMIF